MTPPPPSPLPPLYLSLKVDGQAARRSHPASSRLQGDVFSGRALLDVQNSDSPLSCRCSYLPGLTARHPPRSALRPSGFHGRLLCNPPSVCVHLNHVQRGGHSKTERIGDHMMRKKTKQPLHHRGEQTNHSVQNEF